MKAKFLVAATTSVILSVSLFGCSGASIKAEDEAPASASYNSSSSDSKPSSSNAASSSSKSYKTYNYSSGGKDYSTTESSDGSSLTYGSDGYTQYKHKDGTGMATDGKGNFISDTDGDGSPDSYSTDGGKNWDKL